MTATSIERVAHITCPDELRSIPGWVCWKFEPNEGGGKPRKVPYYVTGGRRAGQQGSPEDRAQLATFEAARSAAARRNMDGVGLALLPEWGLVALDFDNCMSDGHVHPDIAPLLATTYAELSPSGQGVRAFFKGQLGNLKDHGKPFGFEVFSSKGFVTLTGHTLDIVELMGNDNTIAPLDDVVTTFVRNRFKREPRVATNELTESDSPPVGLTPGQLDEILDALPSDLDYDTWVNVGMALHHETRGQGFQVWDAWSQRSPKYTTSEYNEERWRSFGKGSGPVVTARSLVRLGEEHGCRVSLHGVASAADFESIADAPASPTPAGKPARFTPISVADFAGRPAPTWIIKGVLPKAELCVLFGPSGSGKSFMALDLAMCIALGLPWRGRRVRQGRVVYLAAEGAGGFRNRCVAYAHAKGLDLKDVPLDVIADVPNLVLKDDALALAKAMGPCSVVFVDTLAQTTPGSDENSGEDMGKALSHCKGVHKVTGALVVLVHHAGKDTSKGARGWSGIRAAADAELEVMRLANGRLLRTSKQKDGDDNLEWGFGLDVVPIGVDEDGDVVSSCIVTEQETPTSAVLRTLGPNEAVVNEVIQEMAKVQNSGIEVGPLLAEVVRRMPEPVDGKRDTRRQRARRALEALCSGDDAPYWLGDDGCVAIC